MVSFELVHCENEDEKGYYMVRNVTNNDMRDVTQLSTGEKNIIAFLFISFLFSLFFYCCGILGRLLLRRHS